MDEEPNIMAEALIRTSRITNVAEVLIPRFQVPQRDDSGRLLREANGEFVHGPWRIRVRGLHQSEMSEAVRRARRNEETDEPDADDVCSWLIYMATVPEDRGRPGGWDDTQLWEYFEVHDGVGMIEHLLLAGEKLRIMNAIQKLSGMDDIDEEGDRG